VVYSGVFRSVCVRLHLRISAGRVALRIGRGYLGRCCCVALASKDDACLGPLPVTTKVVVAPSEEIGRLNALNARMMANEDKQISLSDPDARSMATSGKGSGIVGYNV
jgi:hypothetical protein